MTFNLQYLSDSLGRHTAVQIPYRDWKAIEKTLEQAEFKTKLAKELREAFTEVQKIESGKVKPKKAEDFLREL